MSGQWEPGIPLYDRPVIGTGAQHIRPMVEILNDEAMVAVITRQPGFCGPCEVSDDHLVCWMCGAYTARDAA